MRPEANRQFQNHIFLLNGSMYCEFRIRKTKINCNLRVLHIQFLNLKKGFFSYFDPTDQCHYTILFLRNMHFSMSFYIKKVPMCLIV